MRATDQGTLTKMRGHISPLFKAGFTPDGHS